MILEDKNKKNYLRRKTVFEYKDTRIILLLLLITIIASVIVSYVAYLFTKEADYTPINNRAIFQPGFSFISTKYIAGTFSLFMIIYSIYEIRKIHLNDKCNLKSINSCIITEKEFMLYLFANSTDIFFVYVFYDKIDYCIYNKKFRRLELYGEFYNENDSLIYAKNLDNPDKKNYFKYYLIRIIFTIICINGIFCAYWSMLFSDLLHVLKFFGDMAIVVFSYKIGFCGYNSFDIHLQIREKEFIFEEVSSVFTNRKIIHSYEFGICDIKEIKRIPYIGCTLVISGKYICTHGEVKVKEHMVNNYKIRFKMSRKDYYKLKEAIRKRSNCEINIKESDVFKLMAYHDWRLV